MKIFSVSQKINLGHNNDLVWHTISKPGALENFHPFCSKNEALHWNKTKRDDKLIYLNGLTYYREFTSWVPKQGFKLNIGKLHGKKSKVHWEIKKINSGCELMIKVTPYNTTKVPLFMLPILQLVIIKPRLKRYLKFVLLGLKYYLDNGKAVKKNQFGSHSWFS